MDSLKNVHIGTIYGAHTKQGIITFKYGSVDTQWSILEAKKLAYMILEAATAAETDAAIFQFFEKSGGLELAVQLMQAMRDHRNKNDPRFFES